MTDPTPQISQVRDERPKIRSLLPQNMQARLLGGIALLMTLVIVFSGRRSAPEKKPGMPATAAQTVDPNQARIQEYRAGIEAATRQLAAEEAQLAQAKQALGHSTPGALPPEQSAVVTATPGMQSSAARIPMSGTEFGASSHNHGGDSSLFASNIALTYRPPLQPAVAQRDVPPAADDAKAASTAASAPETPTTYRLIEGTVIETVLTNRLDSSFSGPVNCLVTTDVYSPDRTVVLIPQGSRVLGEVRKLSSLGEQRLAVYFHRLNRPDGYSINLDKFQGLNQIGETGLRDLVNHHYLEIFGASLAIGAVAGLAQSNTRYGVDESAADAYQQGVTASLSQSSMHVLDRYLNVLPTFTIREGHRVKVYLSQDLSLPAYDPEAELSKEE